MTVPRLGIDFGTTEIKVLWMTQGAKMKSMETIPVPTNARNQRITHSPKLFLKRVRSIPDRFEFRGSWEAALASQRSSFILWNRESGEPRIPLISWRDRRGEPWINDLSEREFQRIHEITGLRPEAGYPLSKLRWIFDEQPELRQQAREGDLCYGSVDTWLLWLGSGGDVFRMDPTQAARTLLYDPEEDAWSRELMREYDIPRGIFPDLVEQFDEPVSMGKIWHNATVISVMGDQPAATIGGQPPPLLPDPGHPGHRRVRGRALRPGRLSARADPHVYAHRAGPCLPGRRRRALGRQGRRMAGAGPGHPVEHLRNLD